MSPKIGQKVYIKLHEMYSGEWGVIRHITLDGWHVGLWGETESCIHLDRDQFTVPRKWKGELNR